MLVRLRRAVRAPPRLLFAASLAVLGGMPIPAPANRESANVAMFVLYLSCCGRAVGARRRPRARPNNGAERSRRHVARCAGASTVDQSWSTVNAKGDDGRIDYKYTGRTGALHTWPPHAWADDMLDRLRALPEAATGPAPSWLRPADYDNLAHQCQACGLSWPRLYNLIQCDALGCPDDQLLTALTADDPNAAVKTLFDREFKACMAFRTAHGLKATEVTMPAFGEFARAVPRKVAPNSPPTIYARDHAAAAAVLNAPTLVITPPPKRRRSAAAADVLQPPSRRGRGP